MDSATRKSRLKHRPKVHYTLDGITKILEAKQANMDKLLHEARQTCARYQIGGDWDTIVNVPRKPP